MNKTRASEVSIEMVKENPALTQGPLPLMQLSQDVDIESRTIYLTDIDVYTSVFIQSRANAIYQITKDYTTPINLWISCYGGEVYGMLGAVDVIQTLLPTRVNTIGVGAVMSAATLLLACGTGKRQITKNTKIMVHQISTMMSGETELLNNEVKEAKVLQTLFFDTLAQYSVKPAAFWKKQCKHNWYLLAKDCIEYGLADEIIDTKWTKE